jgi:Protein of unknown function (DUF1761)
MTTSNNTNWLALGLATIAGMVMGFLWYGLLFTQQWMAGNNMTFDEANNKFFKNGVELPADSGTPMIFNFIAMAFYAFVMNWLLKRTNSTTLQDGAMVGGAIGLISIVGIFIDNLFAYVPTSLSMVDGSYSLVLFTLMGAIIGGWQKR